MSPETRERLTADDLRKIPLFADDDEPALEWLAAHFEVREYESGEIISPQGSPAKDFVVVLAGEVHYRRAFDPSAAVYVRLPGQPTGVLPFSRIKVIGGRSIAVGRTRIAAMPATDLRELVYRAPNLAQKLVAEMTDRTREMAQLEERTAKMLALGKLSAGLAHELNNPASAVVRSAMMMREAQNKRRHEAIALRSHAFPPEAQEVLYRLLDGMADCVNASSKLDALERADLESEMGDWLGDHRLPEEIAADLVDAGLRGADLEALAKTLGSDQARHGLRVLVYDHQILCLTREIEEASKRISDLVQAIKSYSYMDRTPLSEVDVEKGIDVTLRMFQHQLKHGFEVQREFAGNLPKISANGSELNQVWTNLIDNAIGAMSSANSPEKTLSVRTVLEPESVLVEIRDSGPGIPDEIRGKIFEPFFTTKPVGEGTGLGLDIVERIIRNHHGNIRVNSRPGQTTFQVRLPLTQSGSPA